MVRYMNKKDPYFNQFIECDVKNCAYNNLKCQNCTLAKIKVSHEKKNAICDSFKER